MKVRPDYEKLCEQYLLGELSESECQQLEEAYFADDALFERFLAAKEVLLDAYARGELTSHKLERFEKHFLRSPARREKLQEAQDLIQMATTAASSDAVTSQTRAARDPSRWQWFPKNFSAQPLSFRLGLLAALLLIIALGWVVVRQIKERAATRAVEQASNPIEPTGVANGNHDGGPLSTPSPSSSPKRDTAKTPPSPTTSEIASLTLLPFSSRDTSASQPLILNAESRVVRLALVFSGEAYGGLEASVRTVDGQEVVRRRGLTAVSKGTSRTITFTFESSLLTRQDYIATLRQRLKNGSVETIAEYYFRVQHTTTPKK